MEGRMMHGGGEPLKLRVRGDGGYALLATAQGAGTR